MGEGFAVGTTQSVLLGYIPPSTRELHQAQLLAVYYT